MSINLLPWRDARHRQRLWRIWLRILLYGVATCLMLYILKIYLTHETRVLTQQIQTMRHADRQLVSHDPKKHQEALLNRLEQLYPTQSSASQSTVTLLALLKNIQQNLPNNVTLTFLDLSSIQLMIEGYGTQLADIQQYNTTLQQRHWRTTTLSEVHTDTKTPMRIDFTLAATA